MFSNANPLLILAVVLTAGVTFGALARRVRLPAVTGQILVGVVLGPSVLDVFDLEQLHGLQPVTHFALGLMAVAIGSHLHFRRLHNARWRLLLLLIFEVTLTPLLVYQATALVPGTPTSLALLLAALSVSTAPATILAVVKETRSKGVFVKTLVAAVALNNIACICLFELAHNAVRTQFDPLAAPSALQAAVAPIREFLFAAILGGGAGAALVAATRHVVRSDRLATASILAILVTAGLADLFDLSTLLACMFLGVTLANLTPDKDEIGHGVFENFESAILAIFFTLAGLELDFGYVVPAGALAAVLVAARFAGKVTGAHLAMRLAGATKRVQRCLGPALIPQAGVAVGLMLVVTEDPVFAPIRELLLAVGLTSVTVNEIVGPILTRLALARSGDFGKDRARLIDFLHEENISTDLHAETKEEAIRKLVELLFRTHTIRADRARFLESILEREASASTAVGGGLAIPHGILEGTPSMLGVMGISREGLRFETPDGQPVHCFVLLATPPEERERHLEVLAALARSVGSDRNVQQQLFHARSPAHAYEILHAEEESEDFNYFLEDDEE